MRYKLAEADCRAELEREVDEHITQGWRPFGGVNVVRWEYTTGDGYRNAAWWYTQAMVRDDETHPD